MPEPHPRAELRQPRLHRRCRRAGADREPPGRPPHQHRVAGRVGRGQLDQPPGLRRQRVQLAPEAVLDPPGERYRGAEPEPARQLRCRQPAGQLACIGTWTTDFRGDLPEIDVPVLVIQGDADQVLPLDKTGRRLPSLIKDVHLVVIEGGPHAIPWTHAGQVNTALLGFLRP
jgi:pimeloyl-ACP methyl ester carboxylesterase